MLYVWFRKTTLPPLPHSLNALSIAGASSLSWACCLTTQVLRGWGRGRYEAEAQSRLELRKSKMKKMFFERNMITLFLSNWQRRWFPQRELLSRSAKAPVRWGRPTVSSRQVICSAYCRYCLLLAQNLEEGPFSRMFVGFLVTGKQASLCRPRCTLKRNSILLCNRIQFGFSFLECEGCI